MFERLSQQRGTGFGFEPLRYCDIAAFLALSRQTLAPWELEIIEMLDALWRIEMNRNGDRPPDPAD